jgi:putative endonuclease
MSFYVYIAANETDQDLYKGFSEDPYRRIQQHNEGQAQYTATKKTWTLVFVKSFSTKQQALQFERKIKKWNRRSLEKIINSDENLMNNNDNG